MSLWLRLPPFAPPPEFKEKGKFRSQLHKTLISSYLSSAQGEIERERAVFVNSELAESFSMSALCRALCMHMKYGRISWLKCFFVCLRNIFALLAACCCFCAILSFIFLFIIHHTQKALRPQLLPAFPVTKAQHALLSPSRDPPTWK